MIDNGVHGDTQESFTTISMVCRGCTMDRLNDIAAILDALRLTATLSNMTVVGAAQHQFTPRGVTAILLLAESHISIHTWPEDGVAAVTFTTCRDERRQDDPLRPIRDTLKPTSYECESRTIRLKAGPFL